MKSEIHILFPHLFSGLDYGGAENALPSVDTIHTIARTFNFSDSYQGYERELLNLFGLDTSGQDFSSLLASIIASSDLKEVGESILRADPVYLKADRNRVFMVDGQTMAIEMKEAKRIVSSLNDFFHQDKLTFVVGEKPWRWYLRGTNAHPPEFFSPMAMKGRAMEPTLLEMQNMGSLKRLMTEIQMFLHSSDLNRDRLEAGHLPINSLWFWGGHRLAPPVHPEHLSLKVVTDCELARCCAQYCGVDDSSGLGSLGVMMDGNRSRKGLIILDPTGSSIVSESIQKNVIEEAMASLNSGRIRKLRIISRHGHFVGTPLSRYKFWRPSRRRTERLRKIEDSEDLLF